MLVVIINAYIAVYHAGDNNGNNDDDNDNDNKGHGGSCIHFNQYYPLPSQCRMSSYKTVTMTTPADGISHCYCQVVIVITTTGVLLAACSRCLMCSCWHHITTMSNILDCTNDPPNTLWSMTSTCRTSIVCSVI